MRGRSGGRLILVAYLLFGFGYSVLMPPWEASDELAHYRLAVGFARDRSHPEPEQNYEAGQPRLYYWLASWPLRLVDAVEPAHVNPHVVRLNPELRIRRQAADAPTGPGMERLAQHEAFDGLAVFDWNRRNYRLVLGPYVVRWLNLLLGAVAVLFVHGAARRFVPESPATASASACLLALTPQFLHVTASGGNDTLAILAGAFLFRLLAEVCAGAFDRSGTRLLGTMLASVLFPLLAKLTVLPIALALVLVAGARLWAYARSPGSWLLTTGGALVVAALVLEGLGLDLLAQLAAAFSRATTIRPGSLALLPEILESFARSYWGAVGWMSVELPGRAWIPLSMLAGWGAVASLGQHLPKTPASWCHPRILGALAVAFVFAAAVRNWLVYAWVLSLFPVLHRSLARPRSIDLGSPWHWRALWLVAALVPLVLVRNALVELQAQGRYAFPSGGPLALMVVAGWWTLLPERVGRRLPEIVFGLMAALNVAMWFGAVIPVYYQPFLD